MLKTIQLPTSQIVIKDYQTLKEVAWLLRQEKMNKRQKFSKKLKKIKKFIKKILKLEMLNC